MIRFFEERDKNAVISLWNEAFGDKEDEILAFLDFFKSDMLVFEEDGHIVSMLTLIKTQVGTQKGRYVYAVATDKEFRGRCYASALIEFAKQYIEESDEKFLVLVPQGSSLFDFYKKLGFYELCCAERIESVTNFGKGTDAQAETISEEEYFSFRKQYFSGEKYAVWDTKMLGFMKNAYNGSFLVLKNDNAVCGAAFCYKMGDTLIISELLHKENSEDIVNALGILFSACKVFCIKAKKHGEKFAMIYPEEFKETYFGLAMK